MKSFDGEITALCSMLLDQAKHWLSKYTISEAERAIVTFIALRDEQRRGNVPFGTPSGLLSSAAAGIAASPVELDGDGKPIVRSNPA